jgi:hypothetical protein
MPVEVALAHTVEAQVAQVVLAVVVLALVLLRAQEHRAQSILVAVVDQHFLTMPVAVVDPA